MYQAHDQMKTPEDPNIKVWRYLDLAKYISILQNESLFFSRADKLGDPWEGSHPELTVDIRNRSYKDLTRNFSQAEKENYFKGVSQLHDRRKFVAVNCWHANEVESAAMWSIYSKNKYGIAIQSTFSKLCDSFNATSEKVYVGEVVYVDYSNYIIPPEELLRPFYCKRRSFEHEREIRASISKTPKADKDKVIFSKESWKFSGFIDGGGIDIDVDVKKLIEKVYVSPLSKHWILEIIAQVTKDCGYNFEVLRSDMVEKPVF